MNLVKKKEPNLKNQVFMPNWLVYTQCTLFAILFGIWVLPETILVRHVCLIIGALLSLYAINQNRPIFLARLAIPIILIGLLFFWVFFHGLFLTNDFDAQWLEFTTIWKRAAIGFIFAIGLGISIGGQAKTNPRESISSWWIMYCGLALPTIIFWLKYLATLISSRYLVEIPEYFMLYEESAKFFVHKSAYVFFCLPLFGVSLGRLYQIYRRAQLWQFESIIYLVSIFAVLFNFIVEKDRNGEIYAFLLGMVFCILILKDQLKSFSYQKILLGCLITLIPVLSALYQFRNNPQWNTIFSDAKIAVQIDKYNNWQDQDRLLPPINDQGKRIYGTNYERIAWGTAALRLIQQNPLGYGLVERSFGRLGQKVWPEAKLHQSHSAWLDFALGLGIPGIIFLLGAGILSWQQAKQVDSPWSVMGQWGLGAILLLMCTTELSQKVYIDGLIFMISFISSLSLILSNTNPATMNRFKS